MIPIDVPVGITVCLMSIYFIAQALTDDVIGLSFPGLSRALLKAIIGYWIFFFLLNFVLEVLL